MSGGATDFDDRNFDNWYIGAHGRLVAALLSPVLGRRLAENPPVPPRALGELERRWRARRRRRVAGTVVVAAVALAAGSIAGVLTSTGGGKTRVKVVGPPVVSAGVVQPVRPGALAVGPGGELYIADPQLNEILERLHDGRFVVVAGTSKAGFSGDGGPAVRAQLNDPTGMAVGPDGTLYFVDQGNQRVRAIGPDGLVRTVAGGGHVAAAGFVRSGTPALSASFSPSDVTFGPDGRLYIATGQQVVRLEANGTLTPVVGKPSLYQGLVGVGGPAVEGSADGANGIAFDAAGDLYIAGFNTKSLLVVRPSGVLELVSNGFYPRGDAGIVASPTGQVFGMQALSVVAVTPSRLRTVIDFGTAAFDGIRWFSPSGISIGSDGTIYLATYPNGYSDRSAIAAVSPTGSSASLLWDTGAAASPRSPSAPGVLAGDGIGTVTFRQSQAAAVTGLERVLGKPVGHTAGGPAACGVDTVVRWTDLDAYFFEGRFVGYSAVTARLTTEAGLRVGDDLPTAQQLYGSSVVTSLEQGGAWFVATPSGELMGHLTSEPNQPPAPKIATIEAGSVGCPAQAP